MSYAEMCKHEKAAPKDLLESLPESQGGTARHKCVICAYNAGIEEGKRQAKAESKAATSSSAS